MIKKIDSCFRKEVLWYRDVIVFRGLFEQLLEDAFDEIKSNDLQTFTVEDTCKKIMDTSFETAENATNFHLLRSWVNDCGEGLNLVELYQELSKELHGRQWSRQALIISGESFSKEEKCFLLKVAEFFQIQYV